MQNETSLLGARVGTWACNLISRDGKIEKAEPACAKLSSQGIGAAKCQPDVSLNSTSQTSVRYSGLALSFSSLPALCCGRLCGGCWMEIAC